MSPLGEKGTNGSVESWNARPEDAPASAVSASVSVADEIMGMATCASREKLQGLWLQLHLVGKIAEL